MVRKLREIIDELLHQRLGSAVIGRLVGPCLARIEQRSVDPRHRDRDEEAEIRVLAELGIVEAAIKRSVEQRAGRIENGRASWRGGGCQYEWISVVAGSLKKKK